MIEEFKAALKKNGQSLKWFYDHFEVKDKLEITYAGFCHQLNGYAPLSNDAKKVIRQYLNA